MHSNDNMGLVVFEFPSDLSTQDADDVDALLELAMKGIRQRAKAIEARSDKTETGLAVGESAVGNADLPETRKEHSNG